jgi:uncharacterized protein (DUF427 family)
MKLPGPDHPITITPHPRTVRVRFAGRVVAESAEALVLQEASYRPVFYLPRAAADPAVLRASPHTTHCPYKGDASYYSLEVAGQRATNAIWSYEDPFPAMAAIKGYIAFYPDRVEAIEEV